MKFKIKEEPLDEDEYRNPTSSIRQCTATAIVDRLTELESPDVNNEPEKQEATEETTYIRQQHAHAQILLHPGSVVQEVSHVPVSSTVSHAPSSLPASQNWPGQFNFSVSFSPQEKNTKAVAWTYSPVKDKLYVGKDVACPVNFSVNTALPRGVFIRVMAIYTSPGQMNEVVTRCVNHSMEESKSGIFEAEHLVRCESLAATYEIDPVTGRHSVIVPFENPPEGDYYTTYLYKFACFGSCAGGPNRRPLMLVFTLEHNKQVIGRRKLDVKICACPGRDRRIEEGQLQNQEKPTPQVPTKKRESELVDLSEVMNFTKNVCFPPPKKTKPNPKEEGKYVIYVEDKQCYEFLIQMKRFYEMCKMMNGLSPDIQKALMYYQKKKSDKGDSN